MEFKDRNTIVDVVEIKNSSRSKIFKTNKNILGTFSNLSIVRATKVRSLSWMKLITHGEHVGHSLNFL